MFDFVGYLALGLNVFSMYSKGEYRLRLFSAIANFTIVVYAIMINAIIIGCSIAVVLHIYKLYKLKQVGKIKITN